MSVISSQALKSKKPIPTSTLKTLCIDGGFTKISESCQDSEDFPEDSFSATVAIHLTPDGRCGPTEVVSFGGPLTVSFTAKKLWPTSEDSLELIVTLEDLNQVKWVQNNLHTNWFDSKDARITYKWVNHEPNTPREDEEALDEDECEADIACTGFSFRLNLRPKSATELRLDTLIVPVSLAAFSDQTYQNKDDLRYPSFKASAPGMDTVKLLRCETGPTLFGMGVLPWLVDLRTTQGSLPDSYDVKMAISCLMRSAQDPQVKLKFETWNAVSKSHVPSAKKASTLWPKPPRETPLQPAGIGGMNNTTG